MTTLDAMAAIALLGWSAIRDAIMDASFPLRSMNVSRLNVTDRECYPSRTVSFDIDIMKRQRGKQLPPGWPQKRPRVAP